MATSVEATALHLARRATLERARAQARADQLRESLPRVVSTLKQYGGTRVILFGSLATGRFTEQSDVDLAVEGLSGEHYFKALAEVMEVTGAPVDLVRLEEAPPSLVERIAAEGVDL